MARELETEPLTLASRPVPPGKMTYEEFLDWATEDTYAEWVDGEVVWMSPVSKEHDALRTFLLTLVELFAQTHGLGETHGEPFQMKTAPHLPGRSPDILFVSARNVARIRKAYLDGPADVAVEIVGPDSRQRDCVDKLREYEQGGVPEYWLLDQPRRQATFYELGEDGRYQPIPVGEDGIFRSKVLSGFWLKVNWLWQQPYPRILDILGEWGLIPGAQGES
jgi:Uma2 family endonuclease